MEVKNKMKKRDNKGFVLSLDALFAVLIVITALIFATSYVPQQKEKVQQFCNLTNSSYNQSRTLMNLMHQFHFSILTYDAGDWSKKEIECGLAPSGNIIKVVSITRAVMYKNQMALLKFELWK